MIDQRLGGCGIIGFARTEGVDSDDGGAANLHAIHNATANPTAGVDVVRLASFETIPHRRVGKSVDTALRPEKCQVKIVSRQHVHDERVGGENCGRGRRHLRDRKDQDGWFRTDGEHGARRHCNGTAACVSGNHGNAAGMLAERGFELVGTQAAGFGVVDDVIVDR